VLVCAKIGPVTFGRAIVARVGLGGGAFVPAGASYATAFVAGVAALADAYREPSSSAKLIRRLEATTIHPGTSMPDQTTGNGMVDPDAAMASMLPADNTIPTMHPPQTGRLAVAAPPEHPARSVAVLVAMIALVTSIIATFGLLIAVRAALANGPEWMVRGTRTLRKRRAGDD
jgi:membrane-anchored mycosin MYCP